MDRSITVDRKNGNIKRLTKHADEQDANSITEKENKAMNPLYFERNWESNGFTVRESDKGFIVDFWSRVAGCIDGLRLLVPFSFNFPKGTDLYAAWNETMCNGDVIAHKDRGMILRKGHIVE